MSNSHGISFHKEIYLKKTSLKWPQKFPNFMTIKLKRFLLWWFKMNFSKMTTLFIWSIILSLKSVQWNKINLKKSLKVFKKKETHQSQRMTCISPLVKITKMKMNSKTISKIKFNSKIILKRKILMNQFTILNNRFIRWIEEIIIKYRLEISQRQQRNKVTLNFQCNQANTFFNKFSWAN